MGDLARETAGTSTSPRAYENSDPLLFCVKKVIETWHETRLEGSADKTLRKKGLRPPHHEQGQVSWQGFEHEILIWQNCALRDYIPYRF